MVIWLFSIKHGARKFMNSHMAIRTHTQVIQLFTLKTQKQTDSEAFKTHGRNGKYIGKRKGKLS